jgi:hypothetical protein
MVEDFFIDNVWIRGIIANDVLEMNEAIRINPGEFDGNGLRSATVDFPVDPDA